MRQARSHRAPKDSLGPPKDSDTHTPTRTNTHIHVVQQNAHPPKKDFLLILIVCLNFCTVHFVSVLNTQNGQTKATRRRTDSFEIWAKTTRGGFCHISTRNDLANTKRRRRWHRHCNCGRRHPSRTGPWCWFAFSAPVCFTRSSFSLIRWPSQIKSSILRLQDAMF